MRVELPGAIGHVRDVSHTEAGTAEAVAEERETMATIKRNNAACTVFFTAGMILRNTKGHFLDSFSVTKRISSNFQEFSIPVKTVHIELNPSSQRGKDLS